MPGEFFKSEQGEITRVQAEAKEKEHASLEQELKTRKDLFNKEVDSAGQILDDADKKVTNPDSKNKVSGYKKDISGYLTQVAEKGRTALTREKGQGSNEIQSIAKLAGSLKEIIDNAKLYVPMFLDVEKSAGLKPKADEAMKKVREMNDAKPPLTKVRENELIDNADKAISDANAPIENWKIDMLPQDMRKIYDAADLPLKDLTAEIAGYTIDRFPTTSLEKLPHLKDLKTAKDLFEKEQPNIKQVGDLAETVTKNMPIPNGSRDRQIDEIGKLASSSFDNLAATLKTLNGINRESINSDPEYAALYNSLLAKVNLQIKEMANIKLYVETKKIVDGLTAAEKECVVFGSDGNVGRTEKFKQLRPEQQMALNKKLEDAKLKIMIDMDEKTADASDKPAIEARKKLLAGDMIGAKHDLVAFYKQNSENPGKTDRIAEVRGMLQGIAKAEVKQCGERVIAIKSSLEGRYNNVAFGKRDSGTQTSDQEKEFIESMALVLVKAEELIDSGKALTIEDAQAQLRKTGGGYQEGIQADSSVMDAKISKALRVYNNGFSVDINSNAAGVFDVIEQQKLLNDPDPVKREKNTLMLAKSAREHGLPVLSRNLYESYFAKEFNEQAKSVDKEGIRNDFLSKDSNRKNINKQLDKFKENYIAEYKKKNGKEPAADDKDMSSTLAAARGSMENQMIDSAYDKAVKIRVHKGFAGGTGDRAKAWNDAYGGKVALEDIGQEGKGFSYGLALVSPAAAIGKYVIDTPALFTDEDWNALPAKTAIMISITIASMGVASAAAAGAGTVARGLLMRTLGETYVAGTFGTVVEGGVVVGGTALGRGAAWAGGVAVEGVAFGTTQGALNWAIEGDKSTFESPEAYALAMGHSIVTLGVLKGVGTGFGKLQKMSAAKGMVGMSEEAIMKAAYMPKGIGGTAGEAGWWAGRTTAEGASLTGLSAVQSWAAGQEFGRRQAIRSMGENFLFSAAITGTHSFMGGAAHESAGEKGSKKDMAEYKAADVMADEALQKGKHTDRYYSVFSKEIPANFRAEGKTGTDVAGWIDKNGQIHYSSDHFKKQYGVEMTQREGKNVFVVDGKEMTPPEFFRTENGRKVLNEMKQVKDHEVTHRVLEVGNVTTKGELGKNLGKLFGDNREISDAFGKRGAKAESRDLQEFLCEVADGRVKLSDSARKQLEATIGKSIDGFTFDGVRKLDTRMVMGDGITSEMLRRDIADGFTVTALANAPVLSKDEYRKSFELLQRARVLKVDPMKMLNKIQMEQAREYIDATDRKNQAEKLMFEREGMRDDMSKNIEKYEKFEKLQGEEGKLARQVRQDLLDALKVGDFSIAQAIKDHYAGHPNFYEALTYIETNYRVNSHNRNILILQARGEFDAQIRDVVNKSPEEITRFVEQFNLENPGFRDGPRIMIRELPGGKGHIVIDEAGQMLYMSPFEGAESVRPGPSPAKAGFDALVGQMQQGMPLPAGLLKPVLQVPRPTPRPKPGEAGAAKPGEAVQPSKDVITKTPLDQYEEFKQKSKISLSPVEIRDAFSKLDATDFRILQSNIDHMSPDQIQAVIQRRFTTVQGGARYYEGKLAGQGGVADVHLTLFYEPGSKTMVEAVVKTPRTHDNGGNAYSPQEYAARANAIRIEANIARRVMALQHGNPPKAMRTMRPLFIGNDRIVYVDSHSGGGKFMELDKASSDPSISPETFWRGVADIIDELATLHEEGLVHRDIKPENLGMSQLQPRVITDPSGKEMTVYEGGSGRVLDIGSVNTQEQIKAQTFKIRYDEIVKDASGNAIGRKINVFDPPPFVNSTNVVEYAKTLPAIHNAHPSQFIIMPLVGGVTPGYFGVDAAMAAKEGRLPFHAEDVSALGATIEDIGVLGIDHWSKSGDPLGRTPPKKVPAQYQPELERIVNGLKSTDPGNPDYQYVHTTLGGERGVANRMREWFKVPVTK